MPNNVINEMTYMERAQKNQIVKHTKNNLLFTINIP